MYFPTAGVRRYEDERAERLTSYDTGRCLPVWRAFPGHQRVEPWPPARLTVLGRQLLGADVA